jgi:hypothetical protein
LSYTSLLAVAEAYPSALALGIGIIRVNLLAVVWRVSEADQNALVGFYITGSTPLFDKPPLVGFSRKRVITARL